MAKETYYFAHDYSPTNDPKLKAMVSQYKGLGYGMFWRIVEMLHSEHTHQLPTKQYIYIALAEEMGTTVEHVSTFVQDCIHVFELFESDGNFFYSNRVFANIQAREDISILRSKAGKASAEAQKSKKPAAPTVSIENTPRSISFNSQNVDQNLPIIEDNATDIQHKSTHVEHVLSRVQHRSTNGNKVNNNISFKKSPEDSSLNSGIEESSEGCRGENAVSPPQNLPDHPDYVVKVVSNLKTSNGEHHATSRIRAIRERNKGDPGATHSGRASPDDRGLLAAPAG